MITAPPLMIEPLMIFLTILSFVWIGLELARRRGFAEAGGFELWCAALTIGAAAWIASTWIIALAGLLNTAVVVVRTIIVAASALLLYLRRPGREIRRWRADALTLAASAPLALWIAFVVWRSTIVPPLSHDALAYHLPRAVFWIREGAFRFLDLPVDARMTILPANYELLLADVILLGGGDALTEIIAVFFYVAFVIACGALAQRWWASSVAAVGVTLLAASAPVLLLHTGADKNDTMTAFFMVSALVWAGRWLTDRSFDTLALCIVAVAAAIGTKPQGLILAAVLAPVLLHRAHRHARPWLKAVLVAVPAFFLLGGTFYVVKAFNDRSVGGFVAYDDWRNLWQAPWVLVAAPFSSSPEELYVPWAARPWFWKATELYFSHLGVPFAVCAVLLPLTVWLFRRDAPERRLERARVALAALATLLLMLPVRDVPMPHGVYTVALPRYVLFIVPVVFGLTVAPALTRLAVRPLRVVLFVFGAWFVRQAAYAGTNDRFVPIEYVLEAREHPGTRVIAFDPRRAASMADRLAGPNETIAFDAGYGAWIHPAFGADLRRPVVFIPRGDGPPAIPDAARWVVVDRSFPAIWQHPGFRDISQWRTYLGNGAPRPEDLRVIRALRGDPRFELVYHRGRFAEAVFRRR